MDGKQIMVALGSNKYFKGIFTIDVLPVIKKNEEGIYIVNTDTKNGNGE